MDTIPIEALAAQAGLAEALESWRGHVGLLPAEQRGPGPGLRVVPDVPGYAYWHTDYARIDTVPAPGCHFLRDASVCGQSYLFHGDSMILQDSYLSGIARADAEAGRGAVPSPELRQIEILDPVLLVTAPGWQVYGHWLLDFLPRIALAEALLGARLSDFRLLLPAAAPSFVRTLLRHFTTIGEGQIVTYDHETELVRIGRALVPDYAHRDYNLHSFALRFYRGFVPEDAVPHRRICLSRRHVESKTLSAMRFFKERAAFEAMAEARGYEIVCPETLSLDEQIRLMAETKVQIGEHGSAQHASLFSAPGTMVGTIHPMNNIQMQIGRLCGQRNVIAMADRQWTDDRGIIHFTVAETVMERFFQELN